MERLTSHNNGCKREMLCRCEDCDTCEENCPHMNEDNCTCLQEVLEKLAEYEDLEEQGKLLKLPCHTAWFICDKKTATVMPKSIEYLAVYEIDGIDKKGNYWSTRSKALAALKELGRG